MFSGVHPPPRQTGRTQVILPRHGNMRVVGPHAYQFQGRSSGAQHGAPGALRGAANNRRSQFHYHPQPNPTQERPLPHQYHASGPRPRTYNSGPPVYHNKGGGGGHGGGGGGGRGGGGGFHLPKGLGGFGGLKTIKPLRYAKQLTALQYNPIMNQIRHAMNEQQLQGAQNVADIGHWYGQASDQAQAGTQADTQASHQALAGQDAATQAILGALGGSASQAGSGVGAFAALMRGALAGVGEAQHGYDTTMATNVGRESAQARSDMTRLNDQNERDLQDKLREAMSQRGLALQTNLSNSQQLKLQQLAAIQAMGIQGAQAAQNLQLGNQQLQSGQLQMQKLRQDLKGNNLAGAGMKVLHDPTGRQNLANSLINSVMPGSADDRWLSPRTAWVIMARGAQTALGKDPHSNREVFNYVRNIYQMYLRRYEATKQGRNDHNDYSHNTGTPWDKGTWNKDKRMKWRL